MTIPWGWIKQRPHFIAEGLSKDFIVDVFYKRPNHKIEAKECAVTHNGNLSIRSFRYLPFHAIPILKMLPLEFINVALLKLQLPKLSEYDYIYIASPNLYSLIKKLVPKGVKFIYDCMDDYAEFGDVKNNSSLYSQIINNEKIALSSSDYVICSADYLRRKIYKRAGLPIGNAIVVNNAIEIPSQQELTNVPTDIQQHITLLKTFKKSLMYIGAISEWFDFKSILFALDAEPELHVVLVGPIIRGSGVVIPQNPRLHTIGSVQRQYIFNLMPYASALVMPFKVTELIKSVNPVKLYEYIYTGKPVIASRYGESEKFGEFVSLYSTSEEFVNIVKRVETFPPSQEYMDKCLGFVEQNTWKQRAEVIINYISKND